MNEPVAACDMTEGCITCGDIALPLTVIEVRGADAWCRDDDGRTELVALELVSEVRANDRLLVHAGVALERLATIDVEDGSHALRR